jgi:hypothetical protein
MRLPYLLLAATMSLTGPANAFSFFSGNGEVPPIWLDIYAGPATVTSDVTVGMPNSAAVRQNFPSSFFLTTFFNSGTGPINSGTFNGVVNPPFYAGTSTQQVVVTSTLIGFGPGGADDPIFTYTVSPGAQIFGFNAGFATLNPTLGSISALQQAPLLGGLATLNLSQNGSNLDGRFIFTDGSASRTIQFAASSDFDVVYLSPSLSAVPLPPALPLFAFALLALGIFGYVRKKQTSLSFSCGANAHGVPQ